MAWIDALADIEDLEDASFDASLVDEFERLAAGRDSRPIRFSTPTFKEYASTELSGCNKNSFPAFSITAGACGLNCDHCQKKILEPMIPATNPGMLDSKVRGFQQAQRDQLCALPAGRREAQGGFSGNQGRDSQRAARRGAGEGHGIGWRRHGHDGRHRRETDHQRGLQAGPVR